MKQDKFIDFELIKNGYAKRVFVSTQEGADYIIGYYFDLDGNYTTEDKANKVVVKECKYDGTMIKETFFFKDDNKDKNTENNSPSL